MTLDDAYKVIANITIMPPDSGFIDGLRLLTTYCDKLDTHIRLSPDNDCFIGPEFNIEFTYTEVEYMAMRGWWINREGYWAYGVPVF